jgi:hypothetical protein
MRNRRGQQGIQHVQLLRFGLGVLIVGMTLFSFVWWPIQAERALTIQSKLDSKLSQKKAELDALKSRYAALTSLHVLDQWASTHGPWRSPTADDVIIVTN